MYDNVILVDLNDNELGLMPKLEAHEKGSLHRAFSVFIFNRQGEVLLQKRAAEKYHSPNLWSNTCCSHPLPGESIMHAAQRRLSEEMGMNCDLKPAFNFVYKAVFSNGLTEHEYDHVLFGISDNTPEINKEEVSDWKYMNLVSLQKEIYQHPENYTEWLKHCLDKVITHR